MVLKGEVGKVALRDEDSLVGKLARDGVNYVARLGSSAELGLDEVPHFVGR